MSGVAYQVEVNQAQLADVLETLAFVGGNADKALSMAINKTLPKVRTLASTRIREQVRLSATYVRERLELKRSTVKTLSGAIVTPSRGLLLSRFSTDSQVASDGIRWLKPPPVPRGGIKVKVKPGGSAKAVSGGPGTTGKPFYIVLKNSRVLGIAARLQGHGRKVKVLSGPSLSQVFNTVREDVLPTAGVELTAEMKRAAQLLIRRELMNDDGSFGGDA